MNDQVIQHWRCGAARRTTLSWWGGGRWTGTPLLTGDTWSGPLTLLCSSWRAAVAWWRCATLWQLMSTLSSVPGYLLLNLAGKTTPPEPDH